MEYYVNKPYPVPRVEQKNKEYAEILFNSFAGMVSEETAVHQYLYQHFILKEPYKTILEKIAIVEMHHLNLLAETIFLLGEDPKYEVESAESIAIPWTSSYVPYPKDLKATQNRYGPLSYEALSIPLPSRASSR